MSLFKMLMIGGWLSAFAIIGLCALRESGKLAKIQRRFAIWLENLKSPITIKEEELGAEGEDVA